MRAVPRLVSLALVASGLAACQSTMVPPSAVPGGAVPASLPPAVSALLPSNYREQVAAHVVHQYMTDAEGPAEVTPISAGGNWKPEAGSFQVRFPVREEKAQGVYFVRLGDGPRRRCITASVDHSFFSDKKSIVLKTRKIDEWTTCGDGPWEPFPELERMVAAVRACLGRGEKTCELSVKAPESKTTEAKVAETKPARGRR